MKEGVDEWMKLKLKTNAEEEKLRKEKIAIEAEVLRLSKIVEEAKNELRAAEEMGAEASKAVEQAANDFKEKHADPFEAVEATPPSSGPATPREGQSEAVVTITKRRRRIVVTRTSVSEKLGLFFSNNTPEITRVYPGFAAARSNLQAGMVIKEINKQPTNTLKEVDDFLRDGRWLKLDLLVEDDSEDGTAEEDEEFIIVPTQTETSLTDNGDPRSPVEKTHDNHFPASTDAKVCEDEETTELVTLTEDEEFKEAASTKLKEKEKATVTQKQPSDEKEIIESEKKNDDKKVKQQDQEQDDTFDQTGMLSMKNVPTDFVMPELESFKQFCREYAEKHPELINNVDYPEDPNEETVRMLEERRRRELEEDPIAMKELLMRTINKTEEQEKYERRAKGQTEASLSDLLATDDWKLDYERRVQFKEHALAAAAAAK